MKPSFSVASAVAGAIAIAIGSPAYAADTKPAIAATNGKIDASGGSGGLEPAGAVAGTVGTSIGHAYGIQFDGGAYTSESLDSAGLATHIFRRDPESYLVGVTGMVVTLHGDETHRIYRTGLETEFYFADLTIAPSGGYQRSFGNNTGYAAVDALYYVTEDWMLGLGISGYSDKRAAALSSEWRPLADQPISLFANAGAGNDGGGFGMLGVRYSFGMKGATLKVQHRQYDPPNIVNSFTSGGAGGNGISRDVQTHEHQPAVAVAPPPV